MDTPNPNQPAIQSQSQSQGGNKEQSVSKQPMVYICGGMKNNDHLYWFLSINMRRNLRLLVYFQNATMKMRSDQGILSVAESVVIESCTRRGRKDVRLLIMFVYSPLLV